MAFCYNPTLVFAETADAAVMLEVFIFWFSFIPNFQSRDDLRYTILGLSAIMQTSEDRIPVIVRNKLPEIMLHLAQLVLKSHAIRERNLNAV